MTCVKKTSLNIFWLGNIHFWYLRMVFFLSDLCTWILFTIKARLCTKIPTCVYFFFPRRLCRLSIQNDKIFLDLFLILVSQPSTFKIAEIEKKKGKSMAFSKESFNISQYKTGWFYGRKESSWENIMLNTLYTLFIQIEL